MKPIKEYNKQYYLGQLLDDLKHPTNIIAQEAMGELNAIVRHKVNYRYHIDDNGIILNKDVFNLIDKISASIYQVYLDQEILRTDKYFVVCEVP